MVNKEGKIYIIQSVLSEVKPDVFGLIETFYSDSTVKHSIKVFFNAI